MGGSFLVHLPILTSRSKSKSAIPLTLSKFSSMKLSRLLSFLLLTAVVISCKKSDPEPSPGPGITPAPAQTILNVAYGADALQKMDVYLPAGRTTITTKVMVMIHGGGWTSGDKTEFNGFVDTLKRRLPDYAIFNINYRLSAIPVNVFPTQENDVKAAMDFIYGKSAEYAISNKHVLIGASAGGHLAMLQAYKYSTPVKPKAVVSFFGPSDLTDMYNNPVGGNGLLAFALAQAVGKTPTQDSALYANSSPINFIGSASAMPTILLHGGADPLVKPSQSTAVRDKLLMSGIITQYVFYPTGGHGDWNGTTYFDAFNKIETFLKTNVN
jgi:acetyl esterase/lipase